MDIDIFIKEVIVGIFNGIDMAEKSLDKNIIPDEAIEIKGSPCVKTVIYPGGRSLTKYVAMSNLEFEVSLTESNKDGVSGSIGVFLGSVGIGTKGNSEDEKSTLSKIKFNIPIQLK